MTDFGHELAVGEIECVELSGHVDASHRHKHIVLGERNRDFLREHSRVGCLERHIGDFAAEVADLELYRVGYGSRHINGVAAGVCSLVGSGAKESRARPGCNKLFLSHKQEIEVCEGKNVVKCHGLF